MKRDWSIGLAREDGPTPTYRSSLQTFKSCVLFWQLPLHPHSRKLFSRYQSSTCDTQFSPQSKQKPLPSPSRSAGLFSHTPAHPRLRRWFPLPGFKLQGFCLSGVFFQERNPFLRQLGFPTCSVWTVSAQAPPPTDTLFD